MLNKIAGVLLGISLAMIAAGAVPARAEEGAATRDLIPAMGVMADTPESEGGPDFVTHPTLYLTPDKSEVLTLDEDAQSVIVGSPYNLSVITETARRLVLAPQAPGATFFTVLGDKGNVIMQRHVVVAAPREKYVRVRRTCSGRGACNPTDIYWCPDACHAVASKTLDEKKKEKVKEFDSKLEADTYKEKVDAYADHYGQPEVSGTSDVSNGSFADQLEP